MKCVNNDEINLRWHIFYTLKKLNNALEKPSIPSRSRKILKTIYDNLKDIEMNAIGSIDNIANGLSLIDKIILGINYGAPEWPNKLLDLYGPPIKCLVIPFITEHLATSDIQKYLPWWKQPCECYLLPFYAEEQDSPLNLQFFSTHLDKAWTMYNQELSDRFALIFAPGISIMTSNYDMFDWKQAKDIDWPRELKDWIEGIAKSSRKSEVSPKAWDWKWGEIRHATALLLENIPPSQIKDDPLEIISILIAGSIVASFEIHKGASFEGMASLERLIAFACDGSLFLSKYRSS